MVDMDGVFVYVDSGERQGPAQVSSWMLKRVGTAAW